ncbi:MAG: penicillin-binding protein activator LpoB [Lentisphaeria bacterium]|jgi:uncharacterized protein (TIGR02722 family)
MNVNALAAPLAAGALLALATGCQSTVQYGDPTAVQSLSYTFSSTDLQMYAASMVDSLLTFPPIVEETKSRRPVILVSTIKNKTTQHIDMEALTDTVRTKLLRSGKFRFIDRTTDDAAIQEVRTQLESGLVDPATAVRFGQQIGAEYLLTGNFAQITQEAGRTKDVYYKLTMNLKNLRTGILEWSDEKEIRKIREKPVVNW